MIGFVILWSVLVYGGYWSIGDYIVICLYILEKDDFRFNGIKDYLWVIIIGFGDFIV